MAIYKSIRRTARKFGKVALKTAKKRYIKKGALNLKRIGRDVMMLKSMVNAEKKHLGPCIINDYVTNPSAPTTRWNVGLTNGTGEGILLMPITNGALVPYVAPPSLPSNYMNFLKGNNRDQRNGNSIKLHSGYLKIQIAGQASQSMNTEIVFEVYKVRNYVYGDAPTPATLGADLFKKDPLVDRYSNTSGRNPDLFRRFQLVTKRIVRTQQDNTGTGNFVKTLGIPMKFRNHHLRFADDTGGQPNLIDGEMFLVVRCSNGNASLSVTSTSSNATLGLNAATNTGFFLSACVDWYYYDN